MQSGKKVYDETFHLGLNIISGENSSGKSTITDFIFFALGGDLKELKPEAALCDWVIAEVYINDAIIVLKREINQQKTGQPMSIFWGPYDEAMKFGDENWKLFPYKRSEGKESFSQILFDAMKLPQVTSEKNSNITIHQILRLIYVDQISPIDAMFKSEQYDSPLTRQTIGDLLSGIYDDQLYSNQLLLKKTKKDMEASKQQVDGVNEMFGRLEMRFDNLDSLDKEIAETEKRIEKVRLAIRELDDKKDADLGKSEREKVEVLKKEITKKEKTISELSQQHEKLLYELEDSKLFLNSLKMRIESLDDSGAVRETLGKLSFGYCPVCLGEIKESSSKNICSLCHGELKTPSNANVLRMKQELKFQIAESKKLYESKENFDQKVVEETKSEIKNLRSLRKKFEEIISLVQAKRDSELNVLYETLGGLLGQIEEKTKYKKISSEFLRLKKNYTKLKSAVDSLETEIELSQKKQRQKEQKVKEAIASMTIDLLKLDLNREDDFRNAKNFDYDFEAGTVKVNGRNQFAASSMTVLKNSFHLGLFAASLKLDFMRYPRLLIMDDTEDKGMEQVRSHIYQGNVLKISDENKDVVHQVILTTSMLSPDLNKKEFIVGETYTHKNKSLKVDMRLTKK